MAIKPMPNDTERPTRQPRTMDAVEATYGDEAAIEINDGSVAVVEAGGEEKADAAAEELARRLKEKDDEIARVRADAVEARRTAAESGSTLFNAAQQAVNERVANIASAIEGRNQTIESAEAALAAAMNANDAAAMSKAQRAIARAEAELVTLEQQKAAAESDQARLKNAPPPRQQQEQRGPSAESIRWIESHPRFDSDPEYQASVTAAHNAWVSRGKQAGTQEYVDFIERTMVGKYGENHGEVKRAGQQQQPARRERPASSTAARADTSSDSGDSNGSFTIKTAVGNLSLRTSAEGKESVVGKIPPAWAEAAKYAGFGQGDLIPGTGGKKYRSDAEGALAYAVEQMKILQEQRAGSNAGLQFGEGGNMQ